MCGIALTSMVTFMWLALPWIALAVTLAVCIPCIVGRISRNSARIAALESHPH